MKMQENGLCNRVDELVGFVYGELSDREARQFEIHMRDCAACKAEVASFGEIHQSILSWRNESLGINPATAPIVTAPAEPKRSAMNAIREFLNFSPLWMKGATAFASLLFLVCAIVAVKYLEQGSGEVAIIPPVEKHYSATELKVLNTRNEADLKAQGPQAVHVNRPNPGSAMNSGSHPQTVVREAQAVNRSPRRPLSRQERNELATDLGLMNTHDDALKLVTDRITQAP